MPGVCAGASGATSGLPVLRLFGHVSRPFGCRCGRPASTGGRAARRTAPSLSQTSRPPVNPLQLVLIRPTSEKHSSIGTSHWSRAPRARFTSSASTSGCSSPQHRVLRLQLGPGAQLQQRLRRAHRARVVGDDAAGAASRRRRTPCRRGCGARPTARRRARSRPGAAAGRGRACSGPGPPLRGRRAGCTGGTCSAARAWRGRADGGARRGSARCTGRSAPARRPTRRPARRARRPSLEPATVFAPPVIAVTRARS